MGATSVVFYDISRVPSGEHTRPKTRECRPRLREAPAVSAERSTYPNEIAFHTTKHAKFSLRGFGRCPRSQTIRLLCCRCLIAMPPRMTSVLARASRPGPIRPALRKLEGGAADLHVQPRGEPAAAASLSRRPISVLPAFAYGGSGQLQVLQDSESPTSGARHDPCITCNLSVDRAI